MKILCFCDLNIKYFLKDHSQKCRNRTEYIKRWKRENTNVNMLEEEMWEKESREGKQQMKSFKFMSVMLK